MRKKVNPNSDFNLFDKVKDMKFELTLGEALKWSPTGRAQVRKGATDAGKDGVPTEDEEIAQLEDDKDTTTSAYADCTVNGIKASAIIDMGASCSVIATPMMRQLGWSIEKPTD